MTNLFQIYFTFMILYDFIDEDIRKKYLGVFSFKSELTEKSIESSYLKERLKHE